MLNLDPIQALSVPTTPEAGHSLLPVQHQLSAGQLSQARSKSSDPWAPLDGETRWVVATWEIPCLLWVLEQGGPNSVLASPPVSPTYKVLRMSPGPDLRESKRERALRGRWASPQRGPRTVGGVPAPARGLGSHVGQGGSSGGQGCSPRPLYRPRPLLPLPHPRKYRSLTSAMLFISLKPTFKKP